METYFYASQYRCSSFRRILWMKKLSIRMKQNK